MPAGGQRKIDVLSAYLEFSLFLFVVFTPDLSPFSSTALSRSTDLAVREGAHDHALTTTAAQRNL